MVWRWEDIVEAFQVSKGRQTPRSKCCRENQHFFFFLVFSLEKNRLVRGMGGVSVI